MAVREQLEGFPRCLEVLDVLASGRAEHERAGAERRTALEDWRQTSLWIVGYATLLRRAGADIADIQELLGHKSPKTTQRYAMVVPEKLVAATLRVEKVWAQSRGQREQSISHAARKRAPGGQ